MPRKGRKLTGSNIYHVMLRGINQQQIFYENEDYKVFINILYKVKEQSHFELYAYCLMGNHVHILLKTGDESLDTIFRRIGASFVYWYNGKYKRTGHLFQDRFKSEPVEDERYFYCVLRYIFRNPVAAGICKKPEDYPYSNINEYEKTHQISGEARILDFKDYFQTENDDCCMDMETRVRARATDRKAMEWIEEEFGKPGQLVISKENRSAVEKSIRCVISKGVSIRQFSRLSGISKAIVENAIKKAAIQSHPA